MAWGKTGAKAGAKAMHAKHGAGLQTAKQLAADRRNLSKKRNHKHGNFPKKRIGFKKSKPSSLGTAAAKRSRKVFFNSKGVLPLGVRFITYHDKVNLRIKKPTGINRKFKGQISPGGYYKRTGWAPAKNHKMKSHLRRRKPRLTRVSHFRYRSGRFTPR